MIALLQRVLKAEVHIADELTASIGKGLLILVGVKPADDEAAALRLLSKLLKYRVFADEAGKMNLSLQQIAGDLLLVPQFTLAADTRAGLLDRRAPGTGRPPVPSIGCGGPRAALAGCERRVRCPHAGVAHQRRTRNSLAGELISAAELIFGWAPNATEHASALRCQMS